ncbi:hypothetical protein GTA08_BOTSDO01504 [Neofusicoccum parvum]|nr:hypothetical protein GTA08_BOTSDO01504 [Neofusicoccum parvum]
MSVRNANQPAALGSPRVSSTIAGSDDANEEDRSKNQVHDHASDRSPPSSEKAAPPKRLLSWRPWAALTLRRPVLLAFTILFILMIVALEIMYYFSRRDDGIATVAQKEHYLWTYGPTFVLTIVAALWSQAEYQTKQIMPWVEMKHGPAKAEKSMLLNYLTAAIHEALYASVKMGHYSVTLAISGTLILRLLIIASTGLLSLEYREMQHAGTFAAVDSFDFMKNNGTPVMMAGPRFWAIQQFNSSYPAGTTPQFTTQSFAPLDQVTNGTVSADLDVFSADLDCEPFDWAYSPSFNRTKIDIPKEYYNRSLHIWEFPAACGKADLNTTSCSVKDLCFPIEQADTGTSRERVVSVECSEDVEEKHRILIYYGTMGAGVYDEEENQTKLGPPHIDQLGGVICTPKYSLTRRTVTNTTRTSETEKLVDVSGAVEQQLPLGAATEDITIGLVDSMSGEGVKLPDAISSQEATPFVLWFRLLSVAHPELNYTSWDDANLIGDVSQQIFPAFAQQWAKSGKMVAANQTVNGTITQTKERLCVQELSLRLMEAFLAVLILASVALSFSHYLTREESPESLLSNALVLARSPGLAKVLTGTGILPEKEFKQTLKGRTFWTPGPEGTVRDSIVVEPSDSPKIEAADRPSMWQPMASTWAFRIITISIPLLLVITLEVLYQYSSRHDGIADVSTEGYTKYAWVFVPSLTLSLVALLFSMLDFSARLLHPYQQLRKGGADVRTLLFEPLGKPTIVAIFRTLQRKHFALFAILLTSLIGPILTIVTSGLYAAEPIPLSRVVSVELDDWFDFSIVPDPDLGYIQLFNQPVTISDLIAFDNVSYPQWTHDELAFPTLHIDAAAIADFPTNTTLPLTARLPAVRAQMNCTLNSYHHNLTFSASTWDPSSGSLDGYVIPTLPEGCVPRTTNGTATAAGVLFQPLLLDTWPVDGFFATASALYVQEYDADFETFSMNDTLPACAAFAARATQWYLAGTQAGDTTTSLALLQCTPFAEALLVDTHLAHPAYTLDPSAPPTPIESSARPVSHNATALALPDAAQMALLLAERNATAAATATEGPVDPLFQAVLWGRDGVPVAEVEGEQGVERLLAGMRRRYAQVVAQAWRFGYRSADVVPSADGGAGTEISTVEAALLAGLEAVVVDGETRLRLVQSRVSTALLEAALLLMVGCAVVGLVVGREEVRVLPRDPGSVASKMSLLAGSGLVERVREGGWKGGEKDVARRLDGEEFGLGWWDGRGGGRRFGVDVGVAGKE